MTFTARAVEAATSEKFDRMDQAACERAATTLFKKYPGHDWKVAIDGGCMKIWSMNLSSNYGWLQRMSEVTPRDFDKKIMLAGGEILERFGMPAQQMDIQIWKELPRDLRGAPEKDIS